MAPPPPVTPHRFLLAQRKAQSTSKENQPRSALRRQAVDSPAEDNVHNHSSQFAPTPRFSHGRSGAATSQRPSSPPRPTLAQALRASTRPAEDVEETPTENEDDEMLDLGQTEILPTTEGPYTEQANLHWKNDLALSPKRRRIDDDATVTSTANAADMEAAALQPINEKPRFLHSTAQPMQSSYLAETSTPQRPAFVRPPPQAQAPTEPMPEVFSPHRRGQKFVVGGMAATVQQWVLETGQAAVQSRRGQGYLGAENYVMRAKVEEVEGDGPFTVRARLASGEVVHVLLAGGKDSNHGGASRVDLGRVVGLRAPTWELELEGRTWSVGVDWRVLSQFNSRAVTSCE